MNEYDDLLRAAPELNEYDAMLKQQAEAGRAALLTAAKQAQPIDPDALARDLQRAQTLGLPADVIARNPDRIAEIEQANEYDSLLQSSPKLAQWITESGDNAALSKDDHANLSAIEKGLQSFAALPVVKPIVDANRAMVNDSFLTPVFDVQRAAVGEAVRYGGSILSGAGALVDAGARMIDRGVRGFYGDGIADLFWFDSPAAANPATLLDMAGEPLKDAGEAIGVPQERQNIATDIAGGVGQLAAQITQAIFLPMTSAPSLVAQGADIQQERAEEAGQAGTLGADTAVILGGATTAALEKFGIDKLLNRLPPNVKNAALRKVADLAVAGGYEAVQELAEAVTQDVITRALVNPEQEIGAGALREMLAAGGAGTIMRAFVMAVTPGRDRSIAQQDQQALDAVVEATSQSKLRQRDPARFAELVARLRQDGASMVFVPVQEFQRLFQDPLAAARDVLGDPQDYIEATITGGDVAIPIDAYLTKVAPDHHSKIAGKVRLRADGMSADEAAADDGTQTRSAMADFLRSVRDEPADPRVYEDVFGQLIGTGMDRSAAERNAKVVDAMFRTMGQRLGLPAWELYSQYGLRVRRELPEVLRATGGVDVAIDPLLDRLATGDIPSEGDALGPSLAEFLAAQGGIRDDVLTGELRMLAEDDKLRRKPGQRRLVNDAEGLELDRALTAAKEAGYLREDAELNDLLDALSTEVRGEGAMRADANRNPQVAQMREALLALQDELERMGMDPATDRGAIRQALRGVTEGQAFDQGAAVTSVDQIAGLNDEHAAMAEELLANGAQITSDGRVRVFHRTTPEAARMIEASGVMRGSEDGVFFSTRADGQAEGYGAGVVEALVPISRLQLDDVFGDEAHLRIPTKRAGTPVFVGQYLSAARTLFQSAQPGPAEAFRGMTREQFLGSPRITKDSNAADLKPKALDTVRAAEAVPFAAGRGLTARYSPDGAAVYDGDNVVASYNFGDTLVVDKKLRRQGIGEELVYQWRARYPDSKPAASRTKASQALQEKVWERIQRELQPRTLFQPAPIDQTQTPEFRRWFGDSKVVDANGGPLVVYHGTNEDFDVFDRKKSRVGKWGKGFYFTTSREEASSYGKNVIPVYLKAERLTDTRAGGPGGTTTGSGKTWAMKGKLTAGGGDVYLVTDPRQIKSAIGNRGTFDPNDPSILRQSGGRRGGERGQIVLGRSADGSKQFTISLFEGADLSTFLHESGHFFLEVLADAASRPDAPQQVRDDFAAVLQWFGVADRAAIGVEQHEQFARGFEAYLFEGKAPSEELRGPMARFRAWLVSLYRNLTALRVNLTPEVRAVFDRMLATDDEIAAATQSAAAEPSFTSAEQAGMTAEQWAAYQRLVGEQQEEAERELTTRAMREIRREQQAWWKDRRAEVEAEVTAEVDGRRVYQVAALLSRGKRPDGSPLPEGVRPVKLDKAWLLDRYGQKFLNDNLLRRRIYSVEGGVNPDALAADWGYDSGDAMIQELVNSPNREDVIKAETDQRMRDQYGDMLTDGSMTGVALQAVHGNRRMRLLEAEVAAVARLAGRPAPKFRDVLRIAKERIAAKRVRDLAPGQYLRAERAAAKEAQQIAKAGGTNKARLLELKVRQWMNAALYAEARRVQDEMDGDRDYLSRFLKTPLRAKLGKLGNDYLDQIDAILERIDFKRGVSAQAAAKREGLAAFVARQEAAGLQVDIPARLLAEAYRKNYRDMTVEELRGTVDAVRNIEHLAKLKGKLVSAREAQAFEDAVDEMVGSMESAHTVAEKPIDFAPGLGARFGDWLSEVDAWLTKPEFLFKWLDGDRDQGPVWKFLFRPFVDAERAEQLLQAQAAEAMRAAFAGVDRGRLGSEKVYIREIRASMTRAQMVSVALNWGNEGNREALRRGYGWDYAQVEAILSNLTAQELDAVEATWRHIDSYWPQVSALQKELTGLVPEKVEAVPFAIGSRQMRGGYYPLKYDGRLSFGAFKNDEKQSVQELFGGNWARAATRQGHTKERVGSAGMPVKLDLSVATEHIANVIHDLTHRKAVIDISRLLEDSRVRGTIERVAGTQAFRTLKPWLQSIASDQIQAISPAEPIMRRARVGATVVNMGWKVTTAVVQPLGYTQTIEAIGAKWAMTGLRDWMREPRRLTQFALSKSVMLQNRQKTFDRDVRDTLRTVVDGSRMDDVRRSFFYMTGLMDMSVSVPTWLAAYRKAKDGAVDGVPVASEQAAIDYADSVVRMTQSSGSAKDLAHVQRGSELWKNFVMFYSYFNVLYNIGRSRIRAARSVRDIPKLAASAMWLWFIPSVLSELIAGRGPEDEEEWATWWERKWWLFATYPVQTIPLARDIVNGMDIYGYSPSPAFDAYGALVAALQIPGRLWDGDDVRRADVKAAVLATGYWGQLPARQAWITGEYLYDVATGQEQPDDPAEFLGGLMFARPAPDR